MVLVPGALRLLMLSLYVDDGGYLNKVARAEAATGRLSASMQRQSAIMRTYKRDLLVTAGAGALALGTLAKAYADVEEAAARTVFATNDLEKVQKTFRRSVRESIKDSALLSSQMNVTVKRAQDLRLAIEEAGLKAPEAMDDMARAALMLSRATGGVVSETQAFDTLYRTIKLTLRDGIDTMDGAAQAASLYASAIAVAGNESAAGIAKNLQYLNTLKDIELAVPMSTMQLIALSAALSDVNENTREMSRTAIVRLFGKETVENFPAFAQAIIARGGTSARTIGDVERMRRENPADFLFATARAVKGVSRDINPATGQVLATSVAQAEALKSALGLNNTRDLIVLAQLNAGYGTYAAIMNRLNVEQARYIEGGEQATSLATFHRAWLSTLRGQWESLTGAMSRATMTLGAFMSMIASPAMSIATGIFSGIGASPALALASALGAGAYGVRRIRGIGMMFRARKGGGSALGDLGGFADDFAAAQLLRTNGRSPTGIWSRAHLAASSSDAAMIASIVAWERNLAGRRVQSHPMGVVAPYLAARANAQWVGAGGPILAGIGSRSGPAANRVSGPLAMAFNVAALKAGAMRTGVPVWMTNMGVNARLGATWMRNLVMGTSRFGVAGPIGAAVAALGLLTPVFRGIADAMNPIIAQGGAVAGVLRVLRLVFRTLELGGAAISWVFEKIWGAVQWVAGLFGVPLGSLGSMMDRLDAGMANASRALSGGSPASDSSTRESRSKVQPVQYNSFYLSSQNQDSFPRMMQDVRLISAGAARTVHVGG